MARRGKINYSSYYGSELGAKSSSQISQIQALERKKRDGEACGEIETAHPGSLGAME